MKKNRNQIALNWILRELNEKGFFNISENSFPEFKFIVKKAQRMDNESIEKLLLEIKKELILLPFCLN